MKSFYTSLLIFALLLGAIGMNGRYLARISETLCEAVEAIPPYKGADASEEADALRAAGIAQVEGLWAQESRAVSFFVTVRVTEGIEDALGRLRASLENGDRTEFDASREHLIRIARDIIRYGKLDLTSFL